MIARNMSRWILVAAVVLSTLLDKSNSFRTNPRNLSPQLQCRLVTKCAGEVCEKGADSKVKGEPVLPGVSFASALAAGAVLAAGAGAAGAVETVDAIISTTSAIATAAVDGESSILASPPALEGFDLYSRYFLAGGVCCSLSHGVSVPFDVVKTRLQTAQKSEFGGSSNVLSVAQQIIAREGFGMMFKGMGPTLTGYLIQGSFKYGLYEIFKPIVASELTSLGVVDYPGAGFAVAKLLAFMLSGAMAEAVGSTFLSPFEAARIRLVSNPSFATGVVSCTQRLINEEGVGSLFRGLPPIFAKQIPYTVVQLSSYEFLTSSLYGFLDSAGYSTGDIAPYKFAISASCAVVAAVLSSLASQPGDTLLSVVNKSARTRATTSVTLDNTDASTRSGGVVQAESAIAIMREAVEELGIQGLFKGTKARLLHVGVIVVVQLLVYDIIKQMFGIPITGSH